MRRGLVIAGVGRVDEDALDAVEPLDMDEDAFRAFYDLTSSSVWAYLLHITGEAHAADDLLQETYIRFLGARRRWESDAHRRNYLFRIATNLAHDRHRRNRIRRAEPLDMDEDAFRTFYDLTSSAVWAYLSHITGDAHAADDLLQETYIRFLGARRRWESDAHRRNYLFRIATNLAHDRHRREKIRRTEPFDEARGPGGSASPAGSGAAAARVFPGLSEVEGRPAIREERIDLRRALASLSPRERQMLWLAYAEGSSHREIADTLGLRAGGIRVLLFRARRKLAALLTPGRVDGRMP